MLVYLKANPAAFDDGEVRILTAAFDKAWEAVQTSGAKFATDGHVEAARAVIAKHIIERHRGSLEIRSTLGVGTSVTVRLPVAD